MCRIKGTCCRLFSGTAVLLKKLAEACYFTIRLYGSDGWEKTSFFNKMVLLQLIRTERKNISKKRSQKMNFERRAPFLATAISVYGNLRLLFHGILWNLRWKVHQLNAQKRFNIIGAETNKENSPGSSKKVWNDMRSRVHVIKQQDRRHIINLVH